MAMLNIQSQWHRILTCTQCCKKCDFYFGKDVVKRLYLGHVYQTEFGQSLGSKSCARVMKWDDQKLRVVRCRKSTACNIVHRIASCAPKVAFHDWGAETEANQNTYLILVQHTPTFCWRRGTSSWAGEADERNSTQPDNYQTRSWIRWASYHIMNWRFTLCGIVECRADRPHGARRAVHVLIRSLSDFTTSLTGSWSLPRWVLIWIRRALFYTKVDCHT